MSAAGPASVAAVVFTDIVGSTARDRRLGPARADAVRHSHFADVAGIVTRSGGRIVKSLGDGELSVFGSPSSAIDAAVEIQQLCESNSRGQSDPLQLRIGVSAGEVSFDEQGDCFGIAVVEASRLCASARPGEVLISELARLLSVRPCTHCR